VIQNTVGVAHLSGHRWSEERLAGRSSWVVRAPAAENDTVRVRCSGEKL